VLTILSTHPIQYQIPIWQNLAARGRVPFKIYYLSDQGLAKRYDPGFDRAIVWDIDLLSGYDYEFIPARVRQRQDSFWWLRLTTEFPTLLKKHGAKVLWVQGWQVAAYWQAIWWAHEAGIQTWLRAETNLKSTGKGWTRIFKDPALASLFGRVDRFLCIGESNRKFYLHHGIATERLVHAPYCVDNARFATEACRLRLKRPALRAAWGVPDDAFCVLFVGKMIDKKRPLDVLEAARLVQDKNPSRPIHILFVGTGALLEEVRSRSDVAFDFEGSSTHTQSQRAVKASFAGFLNQSEITQAYVAADCLVLPSEATETWGLVVNEAMASGLPVIVSDACGCSDDLVLPFRPDLCFPTGNVSRMSDSIISLMHSPPAINEINHVIERYDVLRTVETVEALYLAGSANNWGRGRA
jgi:glycosyltransferase involved in cell wall biosynthesis